MSNQPNFYAYIPATVRYDNRLKPNAKLLYGEITALCNKEGFCWAENGYFAELYGVAVETISRWISMLEKCNYITTVLNKNEGNTRKIYIDKTCIDLLTKKSIPIDKKINRVMTKKSIAIDEKIKSIYENNTINNTMNRESTALEFLEVNFPSEFEVLMMQHKSRINDYVKFAEMFEATVMQERLVFELNVLRGRFLKYARNWIDNQGKYEVQPVVTNAGSNKKINGF